MNHLLKGNKNCCLWWWCLWIRWGLLKWQKKCIKDVTVVEMLPEMGKDVFFINKISLFNKLAQNHVQLMTIQK